MPIFNGNFKDVTKIFLFQHPSPKITSIRSLTKKIVKLYWKLVKGINKKQIFWSVRKCLNVFVSISQVHCSKVFCSHENEWVNNLSTYKKSILRKVFDMILKLNLNCLGMIDSRLTSDRPTLTMDFKLMLGPDRSLPIKKDSWV